MKVPFKGFTGFTPQIIKTSQHRGGFITSRVRTLKSNMLVLFPQTGLPVWGSYSFQRVASLGRMILPLSPGLHPTLGALGRVSLHLSPTLVFHSGCLGPHEFTLVSHSGCLGPHEFTLVSHLSPTLVSHTCLPHLSPTLGVLGRMILHLFPTCLPHLSPTLGALGRMNLHLSSTCLPHLSPTLVSHTCLPLWVPWAA